MSEKKKRGRRALPKTEKRHKIVVFVKAKNYAYAKKEIKKIAGICNTEEDKIAV